MHQQGHSFPINLSISNVKMETGWIFIAFITDISSFKLLQEEVIRREAQLLQSQLMNEKQDEFLSMASHELKTPLTSMKGYLQLMEKFAADPAGITPGNLLPRALASFPSNVSRRKKRCLEKARNKVFRYANLSAACVKTASCL